MKAISYLLLQLALGIAFVCGSDDPTVSLDGVFDLTPETFDQHVNGRKAALVEFYAPWCGHCKRMTPEFKTLGELVSNDPSLKNKVVVAKVNADEHKDLGNKFDVRGFPTILFFPRGKPVNKDSAVTYDSGRTSDKFLEYLKAKVQEDTSFARIEDLDILARKFIEGAKAEQATILKDVEAAVAKLTDTAKTNGDLYVSYIKKAVEKGADYLATEKARLDKIIASGSLNAGKAEEFARKTSVLGAFAKSEE